MPDYSSFLAEYIGSHTDSYKANHPESTTDEILCALMNEGINKWQQSETGLATRCRMAAV